MTLDLPALIETINARSLRIGLWQPLEGGFRLTAHRLTGGVQYTIEDPSLARAFERLEHESRSYRPEPQRTADDIAKDLGI